MYNALNATTIGGWSIRYFKNKYKKKDLQK